MSKNLNITKKSSKTQLVKHLHFKHEIYILTHEPYGETPRSQIKLKHQRQLINFCVGGDRPVARTIQT
jgi:hypothetical protein